MDSLGRVGEGEVRCVVGGVGCVGCVGGGGGCVVVMSELTASSMSSVDDCSCCTDWLLVSVGRGDGVGEEES